MIVACHCDGTGWKLWGDSNLKSKFWGRSIQLDPVGILTLEFDDGEVFQWSKVRSKLFSMMKKSFNGAFLFLIFFYAQILIELFEFQVTTSIYNLILGKLYCEHYGTMRIQGNQEYSCKLKFKEQSIIDRTPRQVSSLPFHHCQAYLIFTMINITLTLFYLYMGLENETVKGLGCN